MALLLRGQSKYPRGFARKTARHIAAFLLHAIDGVAAARRSRSRGR